MVKTGYDVEMLDNASDVRHNRTSSTSNYSLLLIFYPSLTINKLPYFLLNYLFTELCTTQLKLIFPIILTSHELPIFQNQKMLLFFLILHVSLFSFLFYIFLIFLLSSYLFYPNIFNSLFSLNFRHSLFSLYYHRTIYTNIQGLSIEALFFIPLLNLAKNAL